MKAYLIPGAFEDETSRNYQAVLDVYKKMGYQPEFVRIEWKYKTIDDWVTQVKSRISAEDLEDSILSGFSWGAMIALTAAAKIANPKRLLLFSLSPYFAEDLPYVKKPWLKWSGKRRVASFKKLSMNELAAQVNCPTLIFIGAREVSKYSDIRKRTREARKRISDSRVIEIEDVKHDVADPRYVEAIRRELR